MLHGLTVACNPQPRGLTVACNLLLRGLTVVSGPLYNQALPLLVRNV